MKGRVMRRFQINLENQPDELRTGLHEIMLERGDRLIDHHDDCVKTITFTPSRESEIRSTISESSITIRYHRKNQAFRALGRLLGTDADGTFTECARFRDITAMIDVSRNGVPTVQTVHGFLQKMALMGFNVLMLYMEDTYKISDRPYFGYMRGGYCHEELLAIDDYADSLGIEVIPCIQTLGHLEQILQWPAFFEYRDNDHVILADRKTSVELLAQMIKAVSSPFRTKRIHVGMDEAGGVGQGRYRYLYGQTTF
jgi:N-acetyl-beta-hexosaminidase